MGSTGVVIARGNSGKVKPLPITGRMSQWETRTARDAAKGPKKGRVEVAAIYDKDGNPVGAYQGERHSVSMPDRALQVPGGTLTHLHPNDYFGGTLSITDLKTFSKSQLAEVRAYSKQGQIYSLREGANADKKALLNWARRNEKMIQSNFNRSYESALKQATTPLKSGPHKGQIKLVNKRTGKVTYRQPMTPAQADKYARTYSVGMLDRTYRKNLEKFGFNYTSTKAGKNR